MYSHGRDHLSSPQGPPPLPPAPPSHKQHPSITSLSRSSLANQRSPSPPPSAGLAHLQSTAECVQLQDSWVLGSNVALQSRHFLFKTGTGSTPFFGAAAPGYTMATGAVYSTPARPLPRNTLTRGAFKFKKSPKHCSWKCTALIAVGVAVLLSVILGYCIAMHLFGLNWQLREVENQPAFENGAAAKAGGPTQTSVVTALAVDNGRSGVIQQENNSIDSGQVEVGRRAGQSLPPSIFWRSQLNVQQPRFIKFNISVQKNALIGVYGRKGLAPTHTQPITLYDAVLCGMQKRRSSAGVELEE
uniref:Teneurin N-terminal domain-containing protein n=1 Tax=Knipowitschia caucasica TaxID=637954 RepID=A0AAV2MJ74_KNICA